MLPFNVTTVDDNNDIGHFPCRFNVSYTFFGYIAIISYHIEAAKHVNALRTHSYTMTSDNNFWYACVCECEWIYETMLLFGILQLPKTDHKK